MEIIPVNWEKNKLEELATADGALSAS